MIEQNGIAARATFNAASGELVVNGTDMLAQVGTGNDIDPEQAHAVRRRHRPYADVWRR